MIQLIISLVIKGVFSLFGVKRQQDLESENEALKGRADSVEESFRQQENAREAAEKAQEHITSGSENDVFGSDTY